MASKTPFLPPSPHQKSATKSATSTRIPIEYVFPLPLSSFHLSTAETAETDKTAASPYIPSQDPLLPHSPLQLSASPYIPSQYTLLPSSSFHLSTTETAETATSPYIPSQDPLLDLSQYSLLDPSQDPLLDPSQHPLLDPSPLQFSAAAPAAFTSPYIPSQHPLLNPSPLQFSAAAATAATPNNSILPFPPLPLHSPSSPPTKTHKVASRDTSSREKSSPHAEISSKVKKGNSEKRKKQNREASKRYRENCRNKKMLERQQQILTALQQAPAANPTPTFFNDSLSKFVQW